MLQSKKSYLSLSLLMTFLFLTIFTACSDDPVSNVEDLRSDTFNYEFNEGQLLGDPETAYNSTEAGDHPRNLSASFMLEEMENGNTMITVTLENTLEEATYPVHVHDAADPANTPNGTPYNETPNGNIFAGGIDGTGGTATASMESSLSYEELTGSYEGFVVVHDPTREISTVDLTTYLVLGSFGQDLAAGEANLRSRTFEYNFNEGQLLDNPDVAYDGEHPRDLMASIMVEEQIDGTSTITLSLMNTLDGETYPIHTHDAADPDTTENGTPYNETPNAAIFATMIDGNGADVNTTVETEFSYNQLVRDYEGFFVVHDPTQEISTTDLTTYLILGSTFRD